ncbi:STAS domain-containing protein [Streptomyces sp. NPDC006658]|uniref:STAS domain-containing protein n=1 Tax=Streptomyces sp. NPDC006658 TaxID=3156900 RepID=UPI00340FE37A
MEIGQPSPARVRPGGPAPLRLRTEREHHAGLGRISVLKARGTVDADNAGRLSAALAGHLADAGRTGDHPLLDLTETYLACAAALAALDRATGALARAGRALHVVQPRPHVRETLAAAGLPGIRTYATLTAALCALETGEPADTEPGPARTRPLKGRAEPARTTPEQGTASTDPGPAHGAPVTPGAAARAAHADPGGLR